jgi:hypothetical protein
MPSEGPVIDGMDKGGVLSGRGNVGVCMAGIPGAAGIGVDVITGMGAADAFPGGGGGGTGFRFGGGGGTKGESLMALTRFLLGLNGSA